MRWSWRKLLVWLMVLSTPLQGMAAARMLHCSPNHERMHAVASSPMPGHEHDHEHEHDHADGHGAGVDGTLVDGLVDPSAPILAQSVGAPEATFGASDSSCSACTACCAALGLPVRATGWLALPSPPDAPALSLPTMPSFVPSRLDRPPRALHA